MFRKIIKKLNNFRTASIVMAIISGVAAVYALASLLFYHFAGDLDESGLIRSPGFTSEKFVKYNALGRVIPGENLGLYLGLIVFLAFVGTLITGVMVAYSCLPYIKNKEKLLPRKGLLITGFVGSFFELVLIVMMIIMAVSEHPHTELGVWLTLPLGLASLVGTALYLVAYLKCDFYMPEIKKE